MSEPNNTHLEPRIRRGATFQSKDTGVWYQIIRSDGYDWIIRSDAGITLRRSAMWIASSAAKWGRDALQMDAAQERSAQDEAWRLSGHDDWTAQL